MNVKNWIRRQEWKRRPWPREFSSTLFLKLQRCQPLGGLFLAHHLVHPDERPDYVFRHDCRVLSHTQGDFETLRLVVEKITPVEDAMLERGAGSPPQEHLVVLADADGNVLLQEYCSAERAALLLDVADGQLVGGERRIG